MRVVAPGYFTGSGTVFSGRNYDATRDGRRFLINKEAATAWRSFVLVQNWSEELRRLVPAE